MPEGLQIVDGKIVNLPHKRGRKKGATLEHVRKRRYEVMKLLLKGKSHDQIFNEILSNYTNITEQAVQLDMQFAYAEMRKQFQDQLPDMVARHTAMLYKLFDDWDTMDGNLQLKCISEINKMAGLYRPETAVQVNNLNLNLDNLSVAELKELLNGNSK